MILRRIIEHVRKQQWLAIGIDFVIVVAGVFVGTEVSNWNAARITRQQGVAFTERLIADLREEAWSYHYLIEYYGDVLANAERALAILEGRTAASNEALLVNAYRATQYVALLRRRMTYDEIISTGAIGLIADQTLRETAMRVYTTPMFDNIAQEAAASRYRERFRMVVASEVQVVLAATCGDRFLAIGGYEGMVDSLDYPCSTGLSPADLRSAVNALRSDALLVQLLRLRASDIRTRLAELGPGNPEIQQGLRAFGPAL